MCYFSVHSVRAVKIYLPGSCPVNILIQTHDRPAFMALAERLMLYFWKTYFWQKSGSLRSCWIKLTGRKPQLEKKNNGCKEEIKAYHSLAKFCYILKATVKSHPICGHIWTSAWSDFCRQFTHFWVFLHTCVLSQFSTPQNTTYRRRKARFWNTKKAAFVVYFNFDGSPKIPSFNFLRKSLLC